MEDERTFISDEQGAVAATYAIALTGLIIIAGAAFDYSRIMALDTELQTAADQAALAAVTQLDGEDGACARAGNAAIELLRNITLLSNDSLGNEITINSDSTISVVDDACASFTGIAFYSDAAGTPATTDEAARYVSVTTDPRTARFSFTPVGGRLFGANTRSIAKAGMGSAICEVPPLMICSPTPGTPFDAEAFAGIGIEVTGHGGGASAWSPGDFGFLSVGSGSINDLVQALAFDSTNLPCTPVDGNIPPETGNAQDLYRAFNTRFDVFDFPDSSGTILSECFNGACPASSNSVKDLIKPDTATSGNACKLHNQGWQLPPDEQQFWPLPSSSIASPGSPAVAHHDYSENAGPNLVMGYSRDLCHYDSYGSACPNDRFGNGAWARSDYWAANHAGDAQPIGYGSMTRFEVYQWELGIGPYAANSPNLPDGTDQRAAPVCSAAFGGGGDPLRRVLTVAVVGNCSSLSGSSTNVQIDGWVNMFLVDPVVDSRDNVEGNDVIYMEVIGPANLGSGNGSLPTLPFRRDTAYLIE